MRYSDMVDLQNGGQLNISYFMMVFAVVNIVAHIFENESMYCGFNSLKTHYFFWGGGALSAIFVVIDTKSNPLQPKQNSKITNNLPWPSVHLP